MYKRGRRSHFIYYCVILFSELFYWVDTTHGALSEYIMRGTVFRLNLLSLLAILTVLFLSYCNAFEQDVLEVTDKKIGKISNSNKKNIIMMVTDGTGPSSINMARSYNQFINDLPFNETLVLDKYLIGQSRTRSSSSLITDSAAGATAFSCGLKSYNGAIGVDSNKDPCGTILEALKLKGYKTGLVVTTSLADATPAAFSAHAEFRNMLDLIANQQLGYNNTLSKFDGDSFVDLMIGGGRCSFLPKSDTENSCRHDEVNLIELAQSNGWTVSTDREGFDLLELGNNENIKLPILSLLSYYNMPYEIDRNEKKFPSLLEETKTALNILSRETEDSDEGFFLLIEGSRIDHAGHHNDPHAQVREVLAYDLAFEEVIKFAQNSDVETFIISTSDHETGGADIGRQINDDYPDYVWYPEVLANAKKSGEYLNFKISKFFQDHNSRKGMKLSDLEKFIKDEIIEKDLGILDHERNEIDTILSLLKKEEKKDEINEINEMTEIESSSDNDEIEIIIEEVDAASGVVEFLKDMVSRRARIGWSTHGHTAADVNIYGYSNTDRGMKELRDALGGNVENTDIGKFMESITGVDLDSITEKLKI